jgi:hypothetical protein
MYFGPRKKNLLLSQLKKDVELLSSLNIMDYSLLVGIHDLARGNSENIRGNTLSVYQPKPPLVRTPSSSKRGKDSGHFEGPPLKRLTTNLPTEEFLERKLGFFTSEDGGLFATNAHDEPTGDYIYYFGVIDLLTTVPVPPPFGSFPFPVHVFWPWQYGPKKHLETFFKGFSFPRNELSAVPPDQYAERFVRFIRSNVRPKSEEKPAVCPAKEDLSHVPIPEDAVPSLTPLKKSPSGEVEIGRGVMQGSKEQMLPAIRIEHPSPPMKGFDLPNGIDDKGGVNCVNGGYFEGELLDDVHSWIQVFLPGLLFFKRTLDTDWGHSVCQTRGYHWSIASSEREI